MAYKVKFTRNWGGSELTPDDATADPLVYTEGINILEEYGSDVKVFGKIKIDPEKLMGEDFFVHTPRQVKIKFLAHEFLHNFLKPPERDIDDYSHEINYTLYTDEDGNQLFSDDADLLIGDPAPDSNGDTQEIRAKEVIIKQISKIILQVLDNDNNVIFTGLIDKAKTTYDVRTITIIAYDFMYLIKVFGKQLIKVISGITDEQSFDWIQSYLTFNELLNKIRNMTKLNISDVADFSEDSELVSTMPAFYATVEERAEGLNNAYFSESSVNWAFGETDDIAIAYKVYFIDYITYIAPDQEPGEPASPARWYLSRKTMVEYSKYYFDDVSFETGADYLVLDYRYKLIGIADEQIALDWWDSNIEYVHRDSKTNRTDTVTNLLFSDIGSTRYKTEDGYVFFVAPIIPTPIQRLNFAIYKIQQDYYKYLMPIFENTYTYLELLKTILYLGVKMISVNALGNIQILDKNIYDSEQDVITVDSAELGKLIKPFRITAKESIDFVSEALSIVYWDFETDGAKYVYTDPETGNTELLDTYMKRQYKELYNLFPLDMSTGIRKGTADLVEGSVINVQDTNLPDYQRGLWVVREKLLDEKGRKYKIKASRFKGPLLWDDRRIWDDSLTWRE